MGGRHDIGPGGVDLGMDAERRLVDGPVTLHDLAVMVDKDEVADPDLAEMHAEGVHPEVVAVLGVPGGYVAGDSLVEAEMPEEAEPGCQPLLVIPALGGRIVELRYLVRLTIACHGHLLLVRTQGGKSLARSYVSGRGCRSPGFWRRPGMRWPKGRPRCRPALRFGP